MTERFLLWAISESLKKISGTHYQCQHQFINHIACFQTSSVAETPSIHINVGTQPAQVFTTAGAIRLFDSVRAHISKKKTAKFALTALNRFQIVFRCGNVVLNQGDAKEVISTRRLHQRLLQPRKRG